MWNIYVLCERYYDRVMKLLPFCHALFVMHTTLFVPCDSLRFYIGVHTIYDVMLFILVFCHESFYYACNPSCLPVLHKVYRWPLAK